MPTSLLRRASAAALLRTLTALSLATLATPAVAQPASAPARAPERARVVVLVVNAPPGVVDGASLQRAVTRELDAVVVTSDDPRAATARGTLTVSATPASNELAVSFAEADRAIVSRVVALPAPGDATERAAVRLAGNLARRETDEILGAAPEAAPPAVVATTPAPTAAPAAPAAPPPVVDVPITPLEASLIFPAATNANRPDAHTRFAFNLIEGRVGAVEGGALGTINIATESARGLRIAFLVNRSGGVVEGVDMSLAANLAGGDVEGAQLSGGFNMAKGALRGVQLASVFNTAGGPSTGFQGSIAVNAASEGVAGGQVAAVNTAGDVDGFQIGLVNVAKRVRGVQLGLINVADDIEGLPIGLVSVTKTGGVHPVVWASSAAYGNAGIKFATRHLYTMASVSFHDDGGRKLFGPGFTIGARIPFEPMSFSVDVQALHMFGGPLCCGEGRVLRSHDQAQAKLRGMLTYEALPHLSIFAGGAATAIARYPATGPDTVTVDLVPEVFGGIEF